MEIMLGDYFKEWKGWKLTKRALEHPNGTTMTPQDVEYMHWERQIYAIIKHRIFEGYQFDLFE
jgi:hypothetical protein